MEELEGRWKVKRGCSWGTMIMSKASKAEGEELGVQEG